MVISELGARPSLLSCRRPLQADALGKELFSNRIMINNRWLIVWLDDAFASSAFGSCGHPLCLAKLE
jgi:hypothetical protein